jgi:hypothetical protein
MAHHSMVNYVEPNISSVGAFKVYNSNTIPGSPRMTIILEPLDLRTIPYIST